jgi:hypothetical protein
VSSEIGRHAACKECFMPRLEAFSHQSGARRLSFQSQSLSLYGTDYLAAAASF